MWRSILKKLFAIKETAPNSVSLESSFFSNSAELLAVTNQEGYFVMLSKSWESALGYSREELMARPFNEFVHPDDLADTQFRFKEEKLRSQKSFFKNRYRHKNGYYRMIHWRTAPKGDDGLTYSWAQLVSAELLTEAKLGRTLENLKFGSFYQDVQSDLIYWDKTVCNLFEREERADAPVALQDWKEMVHPEDRERMLLKLAASKASGDNLDIRYRIITPAGETRHIATRGFYTHSDNGQLEELIGIMWDVTSETEIWERLNFVIEGAKLGSWDWYLDTNELSFNRRWVEMLGYEYESMEQSLSTWDRLVHPDDREKAYEDIFNAISGKTEHYENIHRLKHANGSWVWILDRGRVSERNKDGKAIRFSGTHLDLTEQKNIEIGLKAEKKRFETLVYGLNQSALVALYDESGKILSINERYARAVGKNRDELVGRTIEVEDPNGYEADMVGKIHMELDRSRVWSGEVMTETKDGSQIYLDGTFLRVAGEDGQRQYLTVLFDITSRKAAEAKLIQSSKMASLGEMAGGVAHEINNPLAIIKGKCDRILQMMNNPIESSERIKSDLQKVIQTSERIAKIVRGLRTFSRNADGDDFVRIGLKSIIEDTLELCQEKFRANSIPIEMNLEPSLEMECRSTQVSQVVLNLLNNSFDAILELEERWIKIDVTGVDDQIKISVTDSGSGISEEIEDKIMQPFFTTKEVGKGTGLGLSISKGIIEAHGGTLSIDRTCQNTRFVLEIPRKQQHELLQVA